MFALGIIGTGLLALAGAGRLRRLRGRRGAAVAGRTGAAPRPAPRLLRHDRGGDPGRRGAQLYAVDPIKALFWSAVINGVAAVPVMVMIMLMGSRRHVMGQFTLTPWLMSLGWLASAVMAMAAISMFATWGT